MPGKGSTLGKGSMLGKGSVTVYAYMLCASYYYIIVYLPLVFGP